MLCGLTKCIWSAELLLRSCMKRCRVRSKWGPMCISLHFLPPAQRPSDPQPNPKPEKPHPLPLGKVTGQESFMQDTSKNRLCPLKKPPLGPKTSVLDVFVFAKRLTWKQLKTNSSLESMVDEWKNENIWGFPSIECSISFASASISMSQRPMKLNVGVSAGQCRPESIYLHTSTGLVEARLWASHILASLKSRLHQTWVNGLLMDTQRQVLFLLAGALDKKPKATPWLKAVVLTKHCRVCRSIDWQKKLYLFIVLVFNLEN